MITCVHDRWRVCNWLYFRLLCVSVSVDDTQYGKIDCNCSTYYLVNYCDYLICKSTGISGVIFPLLPGAIDGCWSVYCHWHQTSFYLIESLAKTSVYSVVFHKFCCSQLARVLCLMLFTQCTKHIAKYCTFTEIVIFKETLTKQSFVQLCLVYTEAIKII